MSSEIINHSEKASLNINVPHWLVQVRIYNQLSELVETINEFSEAEPGQYPEAAIELEPGVYEIEYAFGEKVDRRLIIIEPGKNTAILKKNSANWKNLQIGSSMLLESNTEAEIKYSDYTENWSTKKTKQTAALENTSIFLSIKIPQEYAQVLFSKDAPVDFQKIFDLKDEQGNSVINFNDDIEKSSEEASIVFNADLPPGFYILEWINYGAINVEEKGPKNNKYYQPVFLHRQWTTQVFVLTHTPSPKAFSLNMARYGMSFQRNDETVIVAEAVLEMLSQEAGKSILTKKRMKNLLTGKMQNPWLGVVAAYALIPPEDLFFSEKKSQGHSADLFEKIKKCLKEEIPDHPDVLALHLEITKPSEKPFTNPPLLKIGLRRVQMHAARHETTVPWDMLTDRIINTPLIKGPWVSWEKLYAPFETTSIPQSDSLPAPDSEISQDTTGKPAVSFSGYLSSKLPIYKLPVDDEYDGSSSQESTLQEVSLINLSQELSKAGNSYQQLPTQINITPDASFIDFLHKIEAKDISMATNLPLSRINTGLKNIIEKKGQLSFNEKDLTDDEQQIILYAFKEEGKKSKSKEQSNKPAGYATAGVESDSLETMPDSAVSDNLSEDETNLVTIEECVAKLQAEANRLSVGFEKNSHGLDNKGKKFAESLINIADKLLTRADFTAKTNPEGKIVCANGAFLHLISLPPQYNFTSIEDRNNNDKEENETQKRNQLLWEAVITNAPMGNSTITAPVHNNYFDLWNLKKVEIYNDEEKAMYGQLNILRGNDAPDCKQETIKKVAEQLSALSLYAPLFGISSSKKENLYEKKMEEIILKLEDCLL